MVRAIDSQEACVFRLIRRQKREFHNSCRPRIYKVVEKKNAFTEMNSYELTGQGYVFNSSLEYRS